MRQSIFNKTDSVLLVGEGNFSFSVSLYQQNLGIDITASCYESTVDQTLGKKNIEYLKENDVHVLLGIDATGLKNYPFVSHKLYDKIIFNFPHIGGKMRIEKNRELLKNFFISCETLINSNGSVLVSLCNGQGGTTFDNPKRKWDDSWKITEMAAHGNFILDTVEPFIWSLYPTYTVTGYRSLDKKFHTAGSLVHIFRRTAPPNTHNISPSKKLNVFMLEKDNCTWSNICNIMEKSISTVSYVNAPSFVMHITFTTNDDYVEIKLYEILYNNAACIIDDIELLQLYLCPIKNKLKRTYKINYKSNSVPLYRKRVIEIHRNIITDLIENRLNVLVDK